MGVIYRNGKYYGGKDAVDINNGEAAIGNGAGGLAGSDIYALGGKGLTESILNGLEEKEVHCLLELSITDLPIGSTGMKPVTFHILRKEDGSTTVEQVFEEEITITSSSHQAYYYNFTIEKGYNYTLNVKQQGAFLYGISNENEIKRGKVSCAFRIVDKPYSSLQPFYFTKTIKEVEDYDGDEGSTLEEQLEHLYAREYAIYHLSLTDLLTEKTILVQSDNSQVNLISGTALLSVTGNEKELAKPWYNTIPYNGPTVQLAGPSLLSIRGYRNLGTNYAPKVTLDGDSSVLIKGTTNGPKIAIQENSEINILGETDKRSFVNIGPSAFIDMWSNSTETPRHRYLGEINGYDNGPVLKITDNAAAVMDKGSAIIMHDKSLIAGSKEGSLTFTNNAQVYFEGGEFAHSLGDYKAAFKGRINITNIPVSVENLNLDTLRDYPALAFNIHGAPRIDIDKNPCVKISGKTTTSLTGIALLKMADGNEVSQDFDSRSGVGPGIVASSKQLILSTHGARASEGVSLSRADDSGSSPTYNNASEFNSDSCSGFGSIEKIKQIQDPGATIVLQGKTRVQFGGSDYSGDGGNVVCSFANQNNEDLEFIVEGNTLFKYSDNAQFRMSGDSFTQMTGNAHNEFHDDSRLIMRGSGSSSNPWNDGLYKGWTRPISNRGNGPVAEIYDKSQILIRGSWDTTEVTGKTSFSFRIPKTSTPINSVADLTGEAKEIFEALQMELNEYYVSGGTITKTGYNSWEDKIEISKCNYSNKPADWKEHPDKIDGSPLIEIIENSEVRLSENIKITGNNNGISFSNGEKTVSFSLDELERLKSLLS